MHDYLAKQIHQIVGFLGNGKLRDGNHTTLEFRSFLTTVAPAELRRYAKSCLEVPFQDSGLVLQDVVHEIGRRLGFLVTNGNYRGTTTAAAPDGLWQSNDGHLFVVEVKTTDVYRIDLDRIEIYKRTAISQHPKIADASVLLIVGREDTGGLEAQVRGSKYAWSTRLLSIDGLLKLLELRSTIDNDDELSKIYEVLKPREYTKVDNIIDLVFSVSQTAEAELSQDEPVEASTEGTILTTDAPVRAGRAVQDLCLATVAKSLQLSLVRESATRFRSSTGTASLVLSTSRPYPEASSTRYWFAFHEQSATYLNQGDESWVAFGCGFEGTTILLPWNLFEPCLAKLNTTAAIGKTYWHVFLIARQHDFFLRLKADQGDFDVTSYLISGTEN